MKKNSRCIVTGANGYLGKHIVYFLKDKVNKIVALDIHPEVSDAISDVEYHQFNVSDKNSINQYDWNADYIFHFSGLTGGFAGFGNYEQYILVNEIGLLNILDKIKNIKINPKIIFPSTRLVYKGSEEPLNEDDDKEAKTIYAVNKLSCENFIKIYSKVYGIKYTIFRICIPYGNLFDNTLSYGTLRFFLDKALAGQNILLFGDGKLKRTFTHISDICEQIIYCAFLEETENETFNISGECYFLYDVAKMLAEKFNVGIDYQKWNEQNWLIESGHTVFNSEKIKKIKGENKYHLNEWIIKLSQKI